MIYSSELRAPGEHKELAVGVDLYVHLVGLAHHQGAVAGGAVPLEALLAVTTQAISTHTSSSCDTRPRVHTWPQLITDNDQLGIARQEA